MKYIHRCGLLLVLFQFIIVCHSECKQYYVIFKQSGFISTPFETSESDVIWDDIAKASNNTISKECIIQLQECSVITECEKVHNPTKLNSIHITVKDNTTESKGANVTNDESVTTENIGVITNGTSEIIDTTEEIENTTRTIGIVSDVISNTTENIGTITNVTSEIIDTTEEIDQSTNITSIVSDEISYTTENIDIITNVTSETTEEISNTTENISISSKVTTEATEEISQPTENSDVTPHIISVATEEISNTTDMIGITTNIANDTKDEISSMQPRSEEVTTFNTTEKIHAKHLPIIEITTASPGNDSSSKLLLKQEGSKKTAIVVAGIVAGSLATAAVTYFIARKIEGLLKSDAYRVPDS